MGFWRDFFSNTSAPSAEPTPRQARLSGRLAEAAHQRKWESVEKLIKQGAASGELAEGHSALFWAGFWGNAEAAASMAPTARWANEADGQTPLMAACAGGHVAAASILMSTQAKKLRDASGLGALGFAAASGSAELVEKLLKPCDDGWEHGKNERWQAAAIAAAMFELGPLEAFEKRGWAEPRDMDEKWQWNGVESLAWCAIAGAVEHGSFASTESMRSLFIKDGDHPELVDGWPILAICQKTLKDAAGPKTEAAIKKAAELDFSLGAPEMPEDWGMRSFSLALDHFRDSYCAIVAKCPELPAMKRPADGATALMLAIQQRRLAIPEDLLAKSSFDETDNLGLSALAYFARSGRVRDRRGFASHDASAFMTLARESPSDIWAAAEDSVWESLIGIGGKRPTEELLAEMRIAVERTSPRGLSRAMVFAVVQGAQGAVELLFPLTSTEENNKAFIEDFMRKNVKDNAMAALVEQKAALLREVEEIQEASPVGASTTKGAARRL